MRIVLCPDSFKESVSAWEVSEALEKGFRKMIADCEIVSKPLADGGEGTVECVARGAGGELVRLRVAGPFGEPVEAVSLLLDEGRTALVEMAQAAGLQLIPRDQRNPLNSSTFGVGELIRWALGRKCRRILIAAGGSGTNDAGMGALRALGVRFFNSAGQELEGKGSDLDQVARIDPDAIDPRLRTTELLVLTDVTNPLYGPDGAARVYAPQKGASPQIVDRLDRGLHHFAHITQSQLGISLEQLPGGGAAGGIGAGLFALGGARLVSGVDTIMSLISLPEAIQAGDCVVSGEGRIDRQTFFGKAVHGMMTLCRLNRKPLFLVCGKLEEEAEMVLASQGVFLFPIPSGPMTISESLSGAAPLLERTARRMAPVLSLVTLPGCGLIRNELIP